MFKIEFKTGNAAFDDNFEGEATKILKNIIEKIQNGYEYGTISDTNGNKIGKWGK